MRIMMSANATGRVNETIPEPLRPFEGDGQETDKIPRAVLSFVVVSYNSRGSIEACLKSITSQEAHPHEVIVVDNASSDGSADLGEAIFPQICVLRTRHN